MGMQDALGRAPQAARRRTGVFISYSHKEATAFDSLMQHLAVVVRLGHRVWTDREIQPGQHWHNEISQALSQAKIAILIVTPSFVASEYVTNHELPTMLRAAQDDGLTIFWIPWHAADTTEFAQFQAAHPPKAPLATLTRAKREQALVAIVERLKALLGAPPSPRASANIATSAHTHGAGASPERRLEAAAFRLELTDELTILLDDREAIVEMDELLHAAKTSDISISVEIPAIASARLELARLEAGTHLTLEERERRTRLRKEFHDPGRGFPRDIFLSDLLGSLIRHLPQLSPAIRNGSDLLECVKATIGYRRHLTDVVFECFRQQGSWSVQFEVPFAVAEAIAGGRFTDVQYLHYNLVELYADEFPPEVRRSRIIPALLWYGGLGSNGASLADPELFDLSRLRVGLA